MPAARRIAIAPQWRDPPVAGAPSPIGRNLR
jgi:hypothetical protein